MAPGSLKAHVHPKCIARPVLQKKKTFRVVENRCLQPFRVVSSRNAPQKWKPIKTLHPWQKNRIVSKQKHKQAKPFGWTWAFKFRPSSCFRKQISVQEKANFLVASLEQSLPLLELCTFKIILHTIAENVSNHYLRTAAHNNRKVFLGSNPGRQGQRRFV